MKNTLVTIIAGAAMCAAALAQNSAPSSANQSAPQAQPANAGQNANMPRVAPGSVIPVQLTRTVDAKKVKTGDQVVATVTMDMKTQTGEILVPKDTKVIGHVTEAQARSKEQKESQLAIAFDQAVLKNEQVSLPMSIQAVIVPQNNNMGAGGPSEPTGPSPAGSSAPSSAGSRGSMGGGGGSSQPPQQSAPSLPPDNSGAQGGSKLPPINAQTQGVIGLSNVTLAAGSSAAQGSVLSSEKSNVKLESGTMLLLKVQ